MSNGFINPLTIEHPQRFTLQSKKGDCTLETAFFVS
jgi:hypothetical protein